MDAPVPFAPPAPPGPRPLSARHPWMYPFAVRWHRARRHLEWLRSSAVWAVRRDPQPLEHLVKDHRSPLLRRLGDTEMWMQHNKVVNLRLASARVDGLLIGPGETFSFNKVVGNCTRRKGYVEGMRLSYGDATSGVGGGVCQLANLLHWLFLHSPLTVLERSEHSFDPFPDSGRVVPWGVGCSIAYNYVDLVVRNDTAATYRISVEVTKEHLVGALRTDRRPRQRYTVFAREERFVRFGADIYRCNEIWRAVRDPDTGATTAEELVRRNRALVRYVPSGATVLVGDPLPG